MEYVIELNKKKYIVKISDSSYVQSCNEVSTTIDDNKIYDVDDIPDLNFFNDNANNYGSMIQKLNMPGRIVDILVEEGDFIKEGSPIIVLESMKMESEIYSKFTGKIDKIYMRKGDRVKAGDDLLSVIVGDNHK
jgi:acetyl/propionyl-CoA carboxylase alpha subunit